MTRPKPGSTWRIGATLPDGSQLDVRSRNGNLGVFDELVVDNWIHLEQMEERVWWMQVGDRVLWIHVGRDGYAEVNEIERRPDALHKRKRRR